MDLIDLTMHRFKHCGDLGDLRCLWEPGELIGGHDQVGAWGLVDVMAVNTNKLIVEVALELAWPSLQVELSLGHLEGILVCAVLRTVDVPVDAGGTVLLSFPFSWGLSTLTLKIVPPRKGGRGGSLVEVLATVYVEP